MLLEPPYRQLLILALTGLFLSLLAYLGYRAKPGRHGWRRIVPSPMHWTGIILGGGLVLLFLNVRLFVGSSRADSESQMRILTGLIIAFSLGVAICAYLMVRIRRLAFEWRGSSIVYRGRNGERVARTMDQLVGVRRSVLGWLVLSFADGELIKLDEHARGAVELMQSIAERRPDLLPNAP